MWMVISYMLPPLNAGGGSNWSWELEIQSRFPTRGCQDPGITSLSGSAFTESWSWELKLRFQSRHSGSGHKNTNQHLHSQAKCLPHLYFGSHCVITPLIWYWNGRKCNKQLFHRRVCEIMEKLSGLHTVVETFCLFPLSPPTQRARLRGWRLLPGCLMLLDICMWTGASCLMNSVESHLDDWQLLVVKQENLPGLIFLLAG